MIIGERFWRKVNKQSGHYGIDGQYPTECWEWIACISEYGYGRFSLDSKMQPAHRVSWILENGSVASDLYVLHKCDNRKCIRIDHLFVGTAKDNNYDTITKGRTNHCKGEGSGNAKLTEIQVVEIRSRYLNGEKQSSIVKDFNVNNKTISAIITRRRWKHIK